MGVGGPWLVSTDELIDKNLPYFVGGNLATLPVSDELEDCEGESGGVVAMSVVVGEEVQLNGEEREPAGGEQQHDQYQHAHDTSLLLHATRCRPPVSDQSAIELNRTPRASKKID